MIWFFRDFLDGPVYIIISILCIVFIMAIIGFMMERVQLEREKKNREAVLEDDAVGSAIDAVPIVDSNEFDDFGDLDNKVNEIDNVLEQEETEAEPTVSVKSVIPENIKSLNAKIPEILDFDEIDKQNS